MHVLSPIILSCQNFVCEIIFDIFIKPSLEFDSTAIQVINICGILSAVVVTFHFQMCSIFPCSILLVEKQKCYSSITFNISRNSNILGLSSNCTLWPSDWGNLVAPWITWGALAENSLPSACVPPGMVRANVQIPVANQNTCCQTKKKKNHIQYYFTHAYLFWVYMTWNFEKKCY